MNENYYIGVSAYKNGLGVSHAMNTVTDDSSVAYEAWFAGYNQAYFDERYDRLHKKTESWWLGK